MALTFRNGRANDIMNMHLADGLTELLLKSRLTREEILTYSAGELASLLNVDEYVANKQVKIIRTSREKYYCQQCLNMYDNLCHC